MKLNIVIFFLISLFTITTTFAEQVTWDKLEKLAECHAASAIIEMDASMRGDYKSYDLFHKSTKLFFDSYYRNAREFDTTNSINVSQRIFKLFNESLDNYKYRDDYSQMKFALGALKSLDCLRLAQ